jgi:hypothetical protein
MVSTDAHRDRARVGVEVVAEVEVPGELAAEDALCSAINCLHEDVPDAAADGLAAGLA